MNRAEKTHTHSHTHTLGLGDSTEDQGDGGDYPAGLHPAGWPPSFGRAASRRAQNIRKGRPGPSGRPKIVRESCQEPWGGAKTRPGFLGGPTGNLARKAVYPVQRRILEG